MAIGKHISLEEARKEKKLDRFCKAHPSEGDEDAFDSIFSNMTRKKPADDETCVQDNDAC